MHCDPFIKRGEWKSVIKRRWSFLVDLKRIENLEEDTRKDSVRLWSCFLPSFSFVTITSPLSFEPMSSRAFFVALSNALFKRLIKLHIYNGVISTVVCLWSYNNRNFRDGFNSLATSFTHLSSLLPSIPSSFLVPFNGIYLAEWTCFTEIRVLDHFANAKREVSTLARIGRD